MTRSIAVRVMWYAYAGLMLIAGYGRLIERIAIDSGGFWSRFGPPLMATVVALAVHVFLNRSDNLPRIFWIALLTVILLGVSASGVFAVYVAAFTDASTALPLVAVMIGLLPAAFVVYQLQSGRFRT